MREVHQDKPLDTVLFTFVHLATQFGKTFRFCITLLSLLLFVLQYFHFRKTHTHTHTFKDLYTT